MNEISCVPSLDSTRRSSRLRLAFPPSLLKARERGLGWGRESSRVGLRTNHLAHLGRNRGVEGEN